jgi:hypothetical protein
MFVHKISIKYIKTMYMYFIDILSTTRVFYSLFYFIVLYCKFKLILVITAM